MRGGRKTLLARRVAATHQRSGGTRSAAEELARRSGSSAGAAKDSLDTSARLPEQAPVEQAVRRGELSLAQAALVSAAAAANPVEAQRLTELAGRVSLAELREECARVKAAVDPDPEATNRRIHAQRRLRHYTDGEGGWNLTARGTAQAGAAFLTVLNAITDAIFQQARRAGRREPVEAYAFDALMHLADHVAGRCACHRPGPAPDSAGTADGEDAHPGSGADGRPAGPADERTPNTADGEATNAGEPGIFAAASSAGPVCRVRPQQSVNPRYLALPRVDVAALRRGRADGDELCEIAGVGSVPVPVARGLLGEAILKLVITDGVDVLNVTHLGRGPTAAQRAALLWINPTCAVEGCNRRRIEWDHREPWATTRHTRLDELDGLCEFHHDLKTRLGWALVPGKGKRAFVPPDDPQHPNNRHKGNEPPAGKDRSTDRGRPPVRDRPMGRPTQRRETEGPNDATGRRRGQTPRAGAGQQPGLFAEPQPP